ncbi:MAG: hypothetical protein Q8P61_08695, partial [Candidatus Nanopelagicales bacterium]|nr:hypothetical protein [Candidatus Nanopelagicales bacterium]
MTGDSREWSDENRSEAPTDPKSDSHVHDLLSTLPVPTMPDEIWVRLNAVIASEAEARSAARQPSADGSEADQSETDVDSVIALPERARAGSPRRWLFAAAGVAAAGLVGMAMLASNAGNELGNGVPSAASVVSMTTSGTKYYRQELAAQVSNRWRQARTGRTASPKPTASGKPTLTDDSMPSVVVTAPPDSSPSPDVLATTFAGTHEGVVECLDRVAPGAEPVMIDIGTYHSDSVDPGTPAAVLAYELSNGEELDVYVVDHNCAV